LRNWNYRQHKIRPILYIKRLDLLKKKYEDKKFYTFIAETIDLNQLENFPFIECWVNTACPRIAEDKKGMININEIKN